jgi:hypothetical protein
MLAGVYIDWRLLAARSLARVAREAVRCLLASFMDWRLLAARSLAWRWGRPRWVRAWEADGQGISQADSRVVR